MLWNVYYYIIISQVIIVSKVVTSHETQEKWFESLGFAKWNSTATCDRIKPNARETVRTFSALLPDFIQEHSGSGLLRSLGVTIRNMSDSRDPVKREAAFRSIVLIPLLLMHDYKDVWCLLEKFQKSLNLFHRSSNPRAKQKSLLQLRELRTINTNVRQFIEDLPGGKTDSFTDDESRGEDEPHDSHVDDIIKHLGF